VSNIAAAIGPARRSRRRLWWVLGCLVYIAVAAAVLLVYVHRLLYGNVTILPVGGSPTAVVVSADGRTIYLANSNDSITPVSVATGKAGRPIAISGGVPSAYASATDGLALTPDGRTLFTTVVDPTTDKDMPIARVDLRSGKETGQIRLPGGVSSFVLSPDGMTMYAVTANNALYAVNVATGRPERRIAVPASAIGTAMVLSPDGRTLYMAVPSAAGSSGGGVVVPVNLQTGATDRAVSVGWEPVSLALTPDGRTLYVAIDGMDGEAGQVAPNRVDVIDTVTGGVRASMPWKVPPAQLAMAPGGATVWVMSMQGDRISTADDTLTPVSVAGDRPGPSVHTGGLLNADENEPMGVTLSPDGRKLYVVVSAGLEAFNPA
jgi:DNA-binding beta-propeller fold protein YncE